jgi:hypothetical protein
MATEPEEIQFTEVQKEKFDPLNSEPIVENLRQDQFQPPPSGEPQKPIPEPQFNTNFTPPPQSNPNMMGGNGGYAPPPNGAAQQKPFNPEFNQMPNNEKDAAAEQAAEVALALYGTVCSLIPRAVIISERKLKKLEKEGKINTSIPLQKSSNDPSRVTIAELVKQHNSTVSQGYEVTNEFKETVREPLIRVMKKNGVGMSDEQFLIFAFGQDLTLKAFHAAKGARDRKDLLELLEEINENYKKGGNIPTPAPSSAPPPPPRNEPEEAPTPKQPVFEKAEVVNNASSEKGEAPTLIINPTKNRRRNRKKKTD